MMTLNSDDSVMRNLARYHYFRHRHLSPAQDADDLYQDAWLALHHDSGVADNGTPVSHAVRLRKAVRRATDRAFGRLRKRNLRGGPSETTMEFDPAERAPDPDLVIDLKQQIESLPLDERLVIELLRRGYEGIEIAGLLELSPQAVTRRKQKAIEKLRQKMG
ncbi:MAG: sigma-70 family RNA polymerase sigma factor [Planctomycetaceae bacterium]|nr:sigma-70 family RNA polymerase sigma factor [Planctomycetaceae bacterium]